MAIDGPLPCNDRFRYARAFYGLFDAILIRLCIHKLERVPRRHILVQPLEFPVVKKDLKTLKGREAKMIFAMRTNLERFLKLALVERIVALWTFDEDPLGFYLALFVFRLIFYLRFVAFEPSHL